MKIFVLPKLKNKCKNYNSKGSRFSEPHAGQFDMGFNPTSLLKMHPQAVQTLRSAFTMKHYTFHEF